MTAFNSSEHQVTFDELADRLVELGCSNHPSEIHGLLCGQLAAGRRMDRKQWSVQVSELAGEKSLSEACSNTVNRLYDVTLEQLEASDFAISLLLPDDDETLGQRAEALGIWCESFLSGFGEGQAPRNLGDEVESVLRDFSEIAQIQEAIDEGEEGERDWLEVSEYVRMALLMVFSEVNGGKQDKPAASKTLH